MNLSFFIIIYLFTCGCTFSKNLPVCGVLMFWGFGFCLAGLVRNGSDVKFRGPSLDI